MFEICLACPKKYLGMIKLEALRFSLSIFRAGPLLTNVQYLH